MNGTTLTQLAGWSAVINGLTSIASTITLILMFAVAAFFGPLNDAISVVWGLTFIPLAFLFYHLHQPLNTPLSLFAAIAGVAAMLVFSVAQMLLVLRVVSFEQSMGLVLSMGAVIGLWALLNGILARSGGILPGGMTWLLIIFGLSFMITAVGWYQSGPQNPLVVAGFLIGAIAGPVWAIWLGRMLLMSDVGLRMSDVA
jgi:MFS family permease